MRVLLRALSPLAAALLLGAPVARAVVKDGVALDLRTLPSSRYEITGVFTVDASSETVWEVLTDYENIPRFVPSMRVSRVLAARPDGIVELEQEAVGGAFLVSRRVSVCLDVTRAAGRLDFADTCRRDFWFYEGGWSTSTVASGVRVSYRLQAQPDFIAPGFLMRRVMSRGAHDLLAQIRAEIVRRSARRETP